MAGNENDAERTVASYLAAFAPAPGWDELPWWPPDVFALANLVLDHTEAYRFVVAPPLGRRWPPTPDWNEQVTCTARQWRAACAGHTEPLPDAVRGLWERVSRGRATPLVDVRTGVAWDLTEALLTLHALADEACAVLAGTSGGAPDDAVGAAGPPGFEARAGELLAARGSLAHLSPTRVRIVPKTHFAALGITIRSLSRYLALCYESVEVRWRKVAGARSLAPATIGRDYHLLLVPWPLQVAARDFRPVPTPLGNMDPEVFGFFEFDPAAPLDLGFVQTLLAAATDRAGPVDAIVLPEAAVEPPEVTGLERVLDEAGTTVLVCGVRDRPTGSAFGRNYVHFGVRTQRGWERYEQDKHHRWCVDGSQIRQYHLGRSLDARKQWWEAIDIPPRTLHVVDVGGGATAVPLVCEDLARLDEVADLVRRIGPTVVVAVLLDGPQLTGRWPCRYAGVLGEEPGSAVLTLTALGMAVRSRPAGLPASRVVARWNDGVGGLREIELPRGAGGVLVSVSPETRTVWTADGRVHHGVPSLVLSGIRPVRAGRTPRARARVGTRVDRVPDVP